MKKAISTYAIGAVSGLITGCFVRDRDFETAVITAICGFVGHKSGYADELIKCVSSAIIFVIIYGSHISDSFMQSNIYTLVRYKKRTSVYFKKLIELVASAVAYSAVYCLSILVVIKFPRGEKQILLSLIALVCVFSNVLIFSLLGNLLSLLLGAASGITLTILATAICTIFSLGNIRLKIFGTYLNPVRHYIINFHDSGLCPESEMYRLTKESGFYLRSSLIYFAVVIVFLMTVLLICVEKSDIGISAREENR